MSCLREVSFNEAYEVASCSQNAWAMVLELSCTFCYLLSSRSEGNLEEFLFLDSTAQETKS